MGRRLWNLLGWLLAEDEWRVLVGYEQLSIGLHADAPAHDVDGEAEQAARIIPGRKYREPCNDHGEKRTESE